MEPRHFGGKDVDEALRAVRAALGPDALILGTRSVPAGNGARVEVTAMRDLNEAPESGPASHLSQASESRLRPQESEVEELKEVRRELAELKSMLCWLIPGMGKGGVLEELITQGVSPELFARLAHETQGTEVSDEREKIRQALSGLILTGGDVEEKGERRECLALIGPSGVGKTTTVVKLTMRLARQGERQVGWVSLDNRRIAGAEQLAVYAGVLGVPYEAAENREGLAQALGRLSACDLVLIDTAGVNPRDDEGLKELAEFMHEIPDLKRTLLLSATTNGRDMTAWVELYGRIGFDSLLFTKVDECRHFGPLINIALTCGRPLSYISIGQRVVNDLEVARPEALARLLLP